MKVIKKFIVVAGKIKDISDYSMHQTISHKGKVFLFQNDYDDEDQTFAYYKASDLNKCKIKYFDIRNRTYWFTLEDIIKMHKLNLVYICEIGEI